MADTRATSMAPGVEPGRILADLAGLLMLEVDEDQRIRWMSPTADRFFNGLRETGEQRAALSHLLPPDHRERGATLFHRFARHRARRSGRIILPMRMSSGDNRVVAWCLHRRSLSDEGGSCAVLCCGRLIDGSSGAWPLASSSEMEPLAVVLHELSQPLAAIANFSEACLERLGAIDREAGLDESLEAMIRQICQQAERGGAFLRRMCGATGLRPETARPIDLGKALRDAMMICAHDADRLGVETRMSVPRPAPSVRCDPAALQMMIVNLLKNAIEAAAEQHSSKARVVEVAVGADGGAAWMTVDDSGPGIAPEIEPGIFDPFVTSKSQGTGIGLSIASRLAHTVGGSLAYEGAGPLGGARFACRIPLQQEGAHDHG